MKFLLRTYQLFISPLIHLITGPSFGCRFEPTCSHYASEAFTSHGFWKGAILTIFRISRCHPFARAGYDPVPRAIGTSYSNIVSKDGR